MSLSLGGNLWVGGVDDVTDISNVADTLSGFRGCIDQLTMNSEPIDLISESDAVTFWRILQICKYSLIYQSKILNSSEV